MRILLVKSSFGFADYDDITLGSKSETGSLVTFTIAVTNLNAEAVTLTSLVDDVFGDLNGQGTCAVPQTLAGSGGTYTCSFAKTISGTVGADHLDTVTATASDDDGNSATASDDATVTFTRPASLAPRALANGPRTQSPAVYGGARPQVAAFADSVLVAFIAEGPTEPYVASVASSDGGRTWGNVTAVSPSSPCMRWSAPSVAASPSGAFAISWNAETSDAPCWSDWGNSTRTFVAISLDRGRTFSEPTPAGGPPGWIGASFGDAVVFDEAARLYVAWHSVSPGETSASVVVANSTDLGRTFEQASFATRLRVAGGNSTAQENLAAGPGGLVFLAWEAFGASGNSGDAKSGIFVRSVTGEAVGDVVAEALAPDVVEVEIRDGGTGAIIASAPWRGSTVAIPELPPSRYEVWLRLDNATYPVGTLPVQTWGRTEFTLRVAPGGTGPDLPWVAVVGVVVGILVVSAALGTLQYTRLAREEILQRKVRLLMYEYIHGNPGCSYSDVRDGLGLQNGVATYHLGVLEKQGLVHSETRRRHRWYYPNGDVSLWRNLPLSPLQASLLEAVRRAPGIGIRELARAVDRRPSSVAYNVRALAREGLLRTDRPAFQRVQCFAAQEDGSA